MNTSSRGLVIATLASVLTSFKFVALAAVHRSRSPGFYFQRSMPVPQMGSGFPRRLHTICLFSASAGTPLEITRNAFYYVLRDCFYFLGKQTALGYLALEAGWNNVANPGSSTLTHGYEMVQALKGAFAKRAAPVVVA